MPEEWESGKGMPEQLKTRVVVPISKGKGDVMDCRAYRGVKLLEHAMKIVERVLENRIRGLVTINDVQFGFMPGKGTTHALFRPILRKMQEEFCGRKKKLYMCFVNLEKAFDSVTESHYASNHGLLRALVFSSLIVQNLFDAFLRYTLFRHGTSCQIQGK